MSHEYSGVGYFSGDRAVMVHNIWKYLSYEARIKLSGFLVSGWGIEYLLWKGGSEQQQCRFPVGMSAMNNKLMRSENRPKDYRQYFRHGLFLWMFRFNIYEHILEINFYRAGS